MTREPWAITREMFLSLDEVGRLLAYLERKRREAADQVATLTDQVIIETLLFSGIRNGEFCRLTRGDVDLSRRGPAFEIRGTPREDRRVYVPQRLAALLREYFAATGGASASARKAPCVPNERGRAYERTALYRRVVRILMGAGLGARASVQLLRHTYGYLAYRNTGGNLLFVQRQLGHAHPMVTSIYAQFVNESPAALADLVAASSAVRQRRADGRRSSTST